MGLGAANLRSIDGMKRFSEQQPRVPAGQSDGGRWTSGGGSGSSSSPPGARQHRDQIAELIADPINPNNVISDSGPALGLQGREDTAIGQLAQDFPEMGGPMAPPNEDVYRKLLDKIATSRDSGQELTPDDVTRVKITLMADKYVGSGYWSYDVSRRLDGYPPESNKCSLFVAEVLTWNGAGAGYPNAGNYFRHPPNAGQWADPS